jgi:hypothetical protein
MTITIIKIFTLQYFNRFRFKFNQNERNNENSESKLKEEDRNVIFEGGKDLKDHNLSITSS